MHTPQTFEVDLITFLQVQFTGVTIVFLTLKMAALVNYT